MLCNLEDKLMGGKRFYVSYFQNKFEYIKYHVANKLQYLYYLHHSAYSTKKLYTITKIICKKGHKACSIFHALDSK